MSCLSVWIKVYVSVSLVFFDNIAQVLSSDPGIGFLSRADREIGVFQQVAPPTKLRIEFPHETGLILSCAGKVGPPCRQRRGVDPPVAIRIGEGIR